MFQANDPELGSQPHYDAIKLPGAWDTTMGNPDVVVQVIDTGIDMEHPDLQNNIWKNPGEICGNGVDDDNNGAQISSNSWGYMQSGIYDQAELDAIDYYNSKDGLVVFAAGFTCYGDWIDISAPGVGIYSTMADEGNYYSSGDYGYSDGTSMACPHVAGVLALGKSVNMAADRRHLLQCMADTAMDTDGANSGTYAGKLGAGLVNAEAFVECAANGAPSKSPTVSPAPTTAAPSLRPTISPAPTPDCGCNHDVLVRVRTDWFPHEASWTFESVDAPGGCEDLQTKGGPWEESETTYSAYATQLACEGVDYKFVMLDSFGDGLCCSNGEGGFELELDGEVIHSGGQFMTDDVFEFKISADGVETNPTPAPVSGGGDDEWNR